MLKLQRLITPTAVALLGVLVSISIAAGLWLIEARHSESSFRYEARELAALVSLQLDEHFAELDKLSFLFEFSQEVSNKEFQQAATNIFHGHPSTTAIAWLETLQQQPGDGRAAKILRKYLEPASGEEHAIEVDLTQNPAADQAMITAMQRGRGEILPGSIIRGVPIDLPIFLVPVSQIGDGRRQHRGYLALSIDLGELMRQRDYADLEEAIDFALVTTEPSGQQRLLYRAAALEADDLDQAGAVRVPLGELSRRISENKPTPPRWEMVAVPTGRSATLAGALPATLLLSGLIITALAALFLRANRRSFGHIQAQAAELQLANDKLSRLAETDGLTGLLNRRAFDRQVDSEWRRHSRDQQPLSLAMLDIDFFKHYNDHYGHQAGDDCLRRVAAVLERAIHRAGDSVARYGGEEFVMILPGDSDGALEVLQRVRAGLKEIDIPHAASEIAPRVTLSVGLCTVVPTRRGGLNDLIERADQALYAAKEQGRDRIGACEQA